MGGQFLLPQRANSEKREFIELQKWMTERDTLSGTTSLSTSLNKVQSLVQIWTEWDTQHLIMDKY